MTRLNTRITDVDWRHESNITLASNDGVRQTSPEPDRDRRECNTSQEKRIEATLRTLTLNPEWSDRREPWQPVQTAASSSAKWHMGPVPPPLPAFLRCLDDLQEILHTYLQQLIGRFTCGKHRQCLKRVLHLGTEQETGGDREMSNIEMHFSQSSCALPSMSKELKITRAKALGVNISFKEALLGIEMHFSQSSCALPSMSKELKITKALLDQGSRCQHLGQRSFIGDRNALLAIKLCTAIDEQGTEDHQGSFGPRLLVSTSRSKKLYWGSKCASRNQAVHCHR